MKLDLGPCGIRSWRWDDQTSLVRHADDHDVWINLRDIFPHPYTLSDAQGWLRWAGETKPETHFAITVGDEAVGGIGITLNGDVFRRSAEIGFWLGREYWGQGLATSAVQALTEWAFASFDLCRIQAGVFAWNPASARVLEKAGYAFEGRLHLSVTKDGKTTDQLLYAITQKSTSMS